MGKNLFSEIELEQYSKHFRLPEIGHVGQSTLKKSKVLCVGAGGLASPVLYYLTAAGIGTLGIVDDDVVEISNLHRQILYTHDDVGKAKVDCARKKLYQLNPNVTVIPYATKLVKDNVLNIMQNYDVIVDTTDNFFARYLINDAAFTLNKPLVHGSIYRFEGQCSVFIADKSPCYRCLYPQISNDFIENCNDAGVLGILPGLLGCIQANEIIKLILNLEGILIGKLLVLDTLSMDIKKFNFSKNPDCILCNRKKDFSEIFYDELNLCLPTINIITLSELRSIIDKNESIVLIDIRSQKEHDLFNIGGVCIPLMELKNKLYELNKMIKTVIYCDSGDLSKIGASLLKEAGFVDVYSLSESIH